MIKKCKGCKPHQQDQIHGENLRVHNPTIKGRGKDNKVFRCTVCGNEN